MIERDEQHRYWNVDRFGRQEMLGVTRTIVSAGLVDDSYFTDLSRGRGKLVHFFCERIATKQPIDVGIHQSVVGYLVALRKWLDRFAPTINGAEVIKGDLVRLLAGQVDLDLSKMLGSKAVVEVKTSEPTAWHGLQLAPYAYLLDKKKWIDRARFGLYLKPNGNYRMKEYDNHRDLDTFLEAHSMLMWRVRHGSYERPYGRREFNPDSRTTDSSGPIPDGEAGIWRSDSDGNSSPVNAGDDWGEGSIERDF